MPWFYGALHCHSTNSDGDSRPAEVARFYREHGFHFAAITDHNRRTGPEDCGPQPAGFAVLGACEYSARGAGRPLHVNGIGATAAVAPAAASGDDGLDIVATLQRGVDGFRAQGAFAVLNHPNWHWAYGADAMLAVRGAHAVELWNGALDSNNLGDEDHPPVEAAWDEALTRGARLWAVASDDCHHFGPRRRFRSDPPFSGWVGVDAAAGDPASLVAALFAGRFYASNGPRLAGISSSRSVYEVEAEDWGQVAQRVVFIGAGGRELARCRGRHGRYEVRGDEGYVRARIETGEGLRAWTQPLFLDGGVA